MEIKKNAKENEIEKMKMARAVNEKKTLFLLFPFFLPVGRLLQIEIVLLPGILYGENWQFDALKKIYWSGAFLQSQSTS